MKIDVKIPEVGESVQEALLVEWYHKDGDRVKKDQILLLIETDKVTIEVVAEADGILHILMPQGETVAVGAVVATLETEMSRGESKAKEAPAAGIDDTSKEETTQAAPSVRALMEEKGIDASQVKGTGPGGRITRGDVLLYLEGQDTEQKSSSRNRDDGSPKSEEAQSDIPDGKTATERSGAPDTSTGGEEEALPGKSSRPAPPEHSQTVSPEEVVRKPMSPIRKRIADHLLHARQSTAMLTTFNEVDMSRVLEARSRFRDAFKEKHGVSLGLMSFFVKASVAALQEIPQVNAFIDGNDIVHHHYHHIGVAVGGDRGLVVPVIRHADRLSFAQIERAIADFIKKIQENKLEISHMEGGTFTISNGGVYGSLLSTPILNTPQSAILGMHKIEDRPMVVDGQIVIRPMMYLALSYDHRIIDGRQAVTFLKRIKECVEHPERILLEV